MTNIHTDRQTEGLHHRFSLAVPLLLLLLLKSYTKYKIKIQE